MHRARSAHEILGLPPLSGLTALPPEEGGRIPYADLHEELTERLREGKEKLDAAGLAAFLSALEAELPASARDNFAHEKQLADIMIATGQLTQTPNLDSPDRQMLWSATLAHMYFTGKIEGAFNKHPLVKALAESDYVDTMFMDFSSTAGTDANVIMGAPGTWFYFDPVEKLINIDLCNALAAGGNLNRKTRRVSAHFEAIFHHEHFHATDSREYPPSMRKLRQEIVGLCEKGGMHIPAVRGDTPTEESSQRHSQAEGLSVDEYKQLHVLQAEWSLRQRFWNAAEDNAANRHNCNLSDPAIVKEHEWRHPDHLADSLNVAITLINRAGKNIRAHASGRKREAHDSPQAQLENLGHAVNMSFFVRNHLAPDTEEGWDALNVNRSLIPGGAQGLVRVKELAQRIEQCQPIPFDEALGPKKLLQSRQKFEAENDWARQNPYPTNSIANFSEWVRYHNHKRNEQIETLFEEFANPLIAEIMRKQEKDVKDKIDREIKGEGKQDPSGSGNGGDGPKQSKSGSGDDNQKYGKGVKVNGLGDNMPVPQLPGENPQEDRTREQQESQGGKSAKDLKDGNKDAETTGDMKRRKLDGTGKRGQQHQQRPRSNHAAPPQSAPENMLKAGQSYGSGAGNFESALDSLQFGNGKKYDALRFDSEFENAVNQVARELERSSRRIRQRVQRPHPKQHELPDSSEALERLDDTRVRHLDLALRNPHELNLKIEDFDIAHTEVTHTQPTLGDIVLLIDGSGSMGSGAKSPMEIAMKTAALIQQAATKADYRTFITLWGDKTPWLVADPKMLRETPDQVAKNIDGCIDNPKACGTLLAPSIPDALDRMLNDRQNRVVNRGFTHFIVISDGYTYDDEAAKKRLQAVLDHVPNATVDAALIQSRNGSLAHTVESLETRLTGHRPIVKVLSVQNFTPKEIVEMVEARVRQCSRNVTATTNAQYSSRLKRARRSGDAGDAGHDDMEWSR